MNLKRENNNKCDVCDTKNSNNPNTCKECVGRFESKLEGKKHPHHDHNHEDHNHENHEHHDHNHENHDHNHHGDHTHVKKTSKHNNLLFRIFNKIFSVLGLKTSHDHSHGGLGHEGHDHGGFEVKFWIMWVGLAFTVIALVGNIWNVFAGPAPILGNEWFEFSIATIMFVLVGIAFIKGSINATFKKQIGEDTLVAISTTSAYVISIIAFACGWDFQVFYEAVEIWGLIYLGRAIEEYLTNRVVKNISSLESLKPKKALVLRDSQEIEININDLIIGDILIIKPGSIIPVDGMVVDGQTTIDESSLTGESLPVTKQSGSYVYGGTVSSTGLVKVEVSKLIGDSFISRIIDGVTEASAAKPKSQRTADKIAAYLIPTVLVIAISVFLFWGIFGSVFHWGFMGPEPWVYSLKATMTILVMACPCSFALMTPISILAASATSKRESVIFSSKTIFETIKDINVIAFDKTGTLTEGKFKVISSTVPDELLPKVIAGEMNSNHPLAKSIVEHYDLKKVPRIGSREIIGKGIIVGGLMIGSHKFVKEVIPSFSDSEDVKKLRNRGSAIIYVFNKEEVKGYIELRDTLKMEALDTIYSLNQMGIEVVMITGDQETTAKSIAHELGIKKENVYFEVDPKDKANIIKSIQEDGNNIAFVGDGVNDSVALVQADIGIAIGEGSDAAIEAADIVLNKNDLTLVPYSLGLSRRTLFTIKRGFGIAIAYNVIAIPFAATGLLPPALGAVSMVLNDSVAMFNAMTLYGYSKHKFDKKNNKKKIIKNNDDKN